MKKKLVVSFLLIAVVLLGVCSSAWAATVVASGHNYRQTVFWTVYSDGLLKITGSGEMEGNTYSGAPWNSYASSITRIEIGEGITKIGRNSFHQTSAVSVSLPSTLQTIDRNEWPKSLRQVYIPDLHDWFDLTFIDGSTVGGANPLFRASELYVNNVLLTELVVPDDITVIGAKMFYRFPITKVIMHDNVTKVEEYAFANCGKLEEVRFSNRLESVGSYAFQRCSSLEEIHLPPNVLNYGSNVFEGCINLQKVTFPQTMREIPSGLLYECTSLEQIELPSSITSIGSSAFSGCETLTTITLPDGLSVLKAYAFQDCTSLEQIELPSSIISLERNIFYGCTSLKSLTLPENISVIGAYSFRGCTGLETITLPGKLHLIDQQAFYGCTALKEIEFPGTVQKINDKAFYGCSQLNNVKFMGQAPIQVAETAFSGVTAQAQYPKNSSSWTSDKLGQYGGTLTWLTHNEGAGEAVTAIVGVLDNITYTIDLQSGKLHFSGYGDMPYSDYYPWISYAELIKTAEFDETITYVSSECLAQCYNLTSVRLPQKARLGYEVFEGCISLTSLVLPDNLTSIPEGLCYACRSLKSIQIPQGVTSIGKAAFSNCEALTSVAMEDQVTYIGDYAFSNCTQLREITIPLSVTEIRDYAFQNCNLTSVYFEGEKPVINSYAFYGATATIEYPLLQDDWESTVESNHQYQGKITWKGYVPGGTSIWYTKIDVEDCDYMYDGTAKTPGVTVTMTGSTLVENVDYSLRYENNVNAGTADVIITGIGNFTGQATRYFDISRRDSILLYVETNLAKKVTDAPFVNLLIADTDGEIVFESSNPSVAIVNSTSGSVQPISAGSTIITASTKGGTNYGPATASYTLSVEGDTPVNPNGPTLADISYSFSNSRASFGYPSNYRIPLKQYRYFFSETLAKFYYDCLGTWGGNCFGFASTSLLFNVKNSGLSLSHFGKSKVGSLKPSDKSSALGMTVRDLLEVMLLSQLVPEIQRNITKGITAVCENMEAAQKVGQPLQIGACGPEGGHALLGYKIKRMNSTTTRIYVYDCNTPNKERYITVKNNSAGKYTSWSYEIFANTFWESSNPVCDIDCIPYNAIKAVWNSRAGTNKALNTLAVDSENFEIQDYSGKVVARMTNGVFTSYSSNVYQYESVDGSLVSDAALIFLPSDVYKVVNKEEGSMEVGMVNKYQSSTVSTNSSTVTLAVVDSDECNLVHIEAQAGDQYNIAMSSELSSANAFEEMVFSGVSDGSIVTLGMLGGEVNMVNCAGVSMWINGEQVAGSTPDYQYNIADYDVQLEYTSCHYTGLNKEPDVRVSNNGFELTRNVDYVVVYSNNVNPGTATAAVYGIGAYNGTAFRDFTIVPATETLCPYGHTWREEHIAIDPADEYLQTITYTCSVCGAERTETIGALTYALTAHSDASATVSLTNGREAITSGMLCAVVYDAAGRIIAFNIKPVSLDPHGQAELTVAISSVQKAASIKAFLLDAATYAPISRAWGSGL